MEEWQLGVWPCMEPVEELGVCLVNGGGEVEERVAGCGHREVDGGAGR